MGEVFAGRYELVDPIGRGGVGAVWRAWDRRRRRYVAAKVLQQRDAHALLRFVREQALRIDHPHVLAPASWAADDDKVLFTMDLVAGGSLVHLVGDYGPLPPSFVCTLLDQLLSGLAAVHAEGVVHRDIKPANLLLEATGTARPRLRLSDFGIAMRLGEPRLTDTNLVVGTPGYISPEQMMGAEPDFPADLFAVGLVALYLLEGAKPDTRALVQYFAEHGTPGAPKGIPEPLWEVVATLLQPDPQARFRTATGARKALAAARELLPEPGPDDELIEIFDQLGPLPPGFGTDGPIGRDTLADGKDADGGAGAYTGGAGGDAGPYTGGADGAAGAFAGGGAAGSGSVPGAGGTAGAEGGTGGRPTAAGRDEADRAGGPGAVPRERGGAAGAVHRGPAAPQGPVARTPGPPASPGPSGPSLPPGPVASPPASEEPSPPGGLPPSGTRSPLGVLPQPGTPSPQGAAPSFGLPSPQGAPFGTPSPQDATPGSGTRSPGDSPVPPGVSDPSAGSVAGAALLPPPAAPGDATPPVPAVPVPVPFSPSPAPPLSPSAMSDTGSFHLPPPQPTPTATTAPVRQSPSPPHLPVQPSPQPGRPRHPAETDRSWPQTQAPAPVPEPTPPWPTQEPRSEVPTAPYTAQVPVAPQHEAQPQRQLPPSAPVARPHRRPRRGRRKPGPPVGAVVPVLLLALACYAVGFWALARL